MKTGEKYVNKSPFYKRKVTEFSSIIRRGRNESLT